jgi:predicted restriction endonuclease
MKLSEHLEAGRGYDLTRIQLDRYGYKGDSTDPIAVAEWLKDHPLIDLEMSDAKTTTTEARPNQDAFRKGVMEVWNGKCAITGYDVPAVLEAAHLHGEGSWRNSNDPNRDGILLRVDLHRLFDKGLLNINADGLVSCSVPDYAWADAKVIKKPSE